MVRMRWLGEVDDDDDVMLLIIMMMKIILEFVWWMYIDLDVYVADV